MPKRVGERGQPCLTLILHLIFFEHPSLVLNLAMTFSYNLIGVDLNSRETFSSSNIFHSLFLGIVLKSFLKSTKQQNRLDLSLWHSSTMILSLTRWSIVEWYFLKPAWPLALLPSLSSHMLIFFSKIIPYNLAKRGLIVMERNFLWLGVYNNRQRNHRNQSLPNMQEK